MVTHSQEGVSIMVTYDTPMKGQKCIQECKEQIQEDILAYFDSVAFVHNDHGRDDLCQIVVDNFKRLEK